MDRNVNPSSWGFSGGTRHRSHRSHRSQIQIPDSFIIDPCARERERESEREKLSFITYSFTSLAQFLDILGMNLNVSASSSPFSGDNAALMCPLSKHSLPPPLVPSVPPSIVRRQSPANLDDDEPAAASNVSPDSSLLLPSLVNHNIQHDRPRPPRRRRRRSDCRLPSCSRGRRSSNAIMAHHAHSEIGQQSGRRARSSGRGMRDSLSSLHLSHPLICPKQL